MPLPDPLTHVRSHPEMYLPAGRLEPSDFAARIAADALACGAGRTLAVHHDTWWAVAADIDWLAGGAPAVADLFRRVIPLPQAGPNSMRGEILLGAFADDVITWDSQRADRIQGTQRESESLRSLLNDRTWRRVIAFRFEPARLGRGSATAEVAPRQVSV